MAKELNIQTGDDNPVLRDKAKEVKKVDTNLLDNMRATLNRFDGLGLAAPQVGVSERFFIMKLLRGHDNTSENEEVAQSYTLLECINPEVLQKSEECEMGNEGCLSLPEKYADVSRPSEIVVKFFDRKGNEQILRLNHMNARIFQHEFDHLEGVLFTDYLKWVLLSK